MRQEIRKGRTMSESDKKPEGVFACCGCMLEFKYSQRRECCQNCDSSGVTLPQDELVAAVEACENRKAYLRRQNEKAA